MTFGVGVLVGLFAPAPTTGVRRRTPNEARVSAPRRCQATETSWKTADLKENNETELQRELGTWAAASIVVGTVIGSGIFLVPKTMINAVGTPSLVFVVWVVGGLLSLAGALSYAELAAAIPEAGGEYAYLREAYGPLWGFLYSWTQLWVAKSGSIATLATGIFHLFVEFLSIS